MKLLNWFGNAFFFVTTPIWWPCLVAVELAQIAVYRPPIEKMLGPMIYDWLQRGKSQEA